MKKFLATLLLMALCLTGLAACGGDTATEKPTAAPGPATAAPTEEVASTVAPDATPEPTEEPGTATEAPVVTEVPAATAEPGSTIVPNTSAPTNPPAATAAPKTAAPTPPPQRTGRDDYEKVDNLKGTVTLSGSTSVYPAAAALREAFIKLYPNVKVSLTNITGSGAGLSDANAGKVSFGMRSSAWDAKTAGDNPKITAYTVALDGVAIVVHPDNTITNITKASLADLYKLDPAITKWNQLAGSGFDNEVLAVCRENGSGTRDCFETVIPGLKGTAYDTQPNRQIVNSTDAVKTAVKGNKQALGYMSLGSVDSSVKALTYEGVVANKANVQSGSYTFQRPFILMFNNTKAMTDAEKEFLRFVYSKQGQEIIDKGGFVDLPQNVIDGELAKIK